VCLRSTKYVSALAAAHLVYYSGYKIIKQLSAIIEFNVENFLSEIVIVFWLSSAETVTKEIKWP